MKNIVITGATGAVGRAAAAEFAKAGQNRLILAGRNLQKLSALRSELQKHYPSLQTELIELDLSDLSSVKRAAITIGKKFPEIHGLVNIAAIYKHQKSFNSAGHEAMFATNHLGPFAFTVSLLNTIKQTPGAKILNVAAPSSTRIDFENLNAEKKFSAFTSFGASKMMNLLFSFKLAEELKQSGQACMAFHPGLVKSELMNEAPKLLSLFLGMVSSAPQKTGAAIRELVMSGEARERNGKFYNNRLKEMKAAGHAYDKQVQDRLWTESLKLSELG